MQQQAEQRPRRAQRRRPHPNVYRAATNLAPYPAFSQEERQRRWGLVREEMERARLDCLIIPPSGGEASELGATVRYLMHVGAAGVDVSAVFPLTHEPAAITPDPAPWSASQPWCVDLRRAEPTHAAAMLVKLKESGLRKRRIGVFGLGADGSGGDAPAAFLRALEEALPRTTWVDFAHQIRRIRAHKSAEELAFLRQSARIVDAAYDALFDALLGGRSELDVWASVAEALCRLGSELPIGIRWGYGAEQGRLSSTLPGGRVTPGRLALTEIEAAWGGYRARGRQPISLGPSNPADAELFEIARDVWTEAFHAIHPGLFLDELQHRVEHASPRSTRSPALANDLACWLVASGCGLGADVPVLGRLPSDTLGGDWPLAPGACFSLAVVAASGERCVTWGDSVVVTKRGAERLGTAEPRLRVKDA